MRDTPIVKLSAIIIIVGLVIGGWRSWHSWSGASSSESTVNVELLTTADKASWVRSQVFSFNDEHAGKWQVTVSYADSRTAMQHLLAGTEHPGLWSPDSPIWIARANAVWTAHNGAPLVNMDDPSSFRVFLKSPLVFMTTRRKAAWLRPRLAGDPWGSVYLMGAGRLSPPWGSLRYSIADPTASNSGMAALGMMLNAYARTHPSDTPLASVAASPKFGRFLDVVRRNLVYDRACRQGTAALTDAYVAHLSSRDFIVTYENVAVAAARKNKDIVVIYPSPTEVAEQSACIVDGPWTTPDQRQVAEAFMEYIGEPQSLALAHKYHLRLADTLNMTTADENLTAFTSQGFQENYTTEEPPPYDALNVAAVQWVKSGGR